jgi:hypothetical protein
MEKLGHISIVHKGSLRDENMYVEVSYPINKKKITCYINIVRVLESMKKRYSM